MEAWFIRRYGGREVLERGEVPEPAIGPHDLLVEIRAASVNPVDWKIREGKLRRILSYSFPLVLGNDLAGEVLDCGAEVTDFAPGDRIFARADKRRIGAFAERIAIPDSCAARAPASLSDAEAAAVPLAGLTAYQALVEIAAVGPGDKVLIQAGAGGVGSFAIQLARHLGAEIATTASVSKHGLVRELGADLVIDYRTEDYTRQLSGYGVVLDGLGGAEIRRAFSILAPGGIVISLIGVPDPDFAAAWHLGALERLAVRAMSWPTRRAAAKAGVRYRFWFMREDGDQLAAIAELIEAGAIRPVVDRIFDFGAVDQAIAYAERGHATGKVIVQRSPGATSSCPN